MTSILDYPVEAREGRIAYQSPEIRENYTNFCFLVFDCGLHMVIVEQVTPHQSGKNRFALSADKPFAHTLTEAKEFCTEFVREWMQCEEDHQAAGREAMSDDDPHDYEDGQYYDDDEEDEDEEPTTLEALIRTFDYVCANGCSDEWMGTQCIGCGWSPVPEWKSNLEA